MSLSPIEEVAVGEKGWVEEGREGKDVPGHLLSLRQGRDAEPPRQNSGHGRPGFSPHKIIEVGGGRN